MFTHVAGAFLKSMGSYVSSVNMISNCICNLKVFEVALIQGTWENGVSDSKQICLAKEALLIEE